MAKDNVYMTIYIIYMSNRMIFTMQIRLFTWHKIYEKIYKRLSIHFTSFKSPFTSNSIISGYLALLSNISSLRVMLIHSLSNCSKVFQTNDILEMILKIFLSCKIY